MTFTPAGGGRVLFIRNDNLYSQRLDRKVGKLAGDPELVQERVASVPGSRRAYFSVSNGGTLAWRNGTVWLSQATIFDRKGTRISVAGTPAPMNIIRLSPDESRLLAQDEAASSILEANGPGRIGLNIVAYLHLLWSADGARLVFVQGAKKLMDRPMTDTRPVRELAEIPEFSGVLDGISPDGRRILYGSSAGVSMLTLGANVKPQTVVGQRADSVWMSPDWVWLVYHPNGDAGIYAQPLSGAALPRQIANTGNYPVWRADGKEILYYVNGKDPAVWSVRVEGSGIALRFAPPERLFSVAPPVGAGTGAHPLAVNRDGSRIYFLERRDQPEFDLIRMHTRAIQ